MDQGQAEGARANRRAAAWWCCSGCGRRPPADAGLTGWGLERRRGAAAILRVTSSQRISRKGFTCPCSRRSTGSFFRCTSWCCSGSSGGLRGSRTPRRTTSSAGRNVGFFVDRWLAVRFEHRFGAHRRPVGAGRDHAAWRWPTTSCTRGSWCCWRGCSCRSTTGGGLHGARVPREALQPAARMVLASSRCWPTCSRRSRDGLRRRQGLQTLLPDTFGSPENAFWVGAIRHRDY